MFEISGVNVTQLPPEVIIDIAKMAMFGPGGISVWQLLIILVIVVLVFGTKKLKGTGSDLGAAIRGFRKSVREDPEDEKKEEENEKEEEKKIEESSDSESKKK